MSEEPSNESSETTRPGRWRRNLEGARNALRHPTPTQREALARYLHTLSAAALNGGATLPFTEAQITLYLVTRVAIALALAVGLFVAGALTLEGAQ